MTYEEFLPYVLTSAPSCPRDTALRHIRLAAIDFCARTGVWREELDGIVANGAGRQALPINDQTEIVKLIRVEIADGVDSAPYVAELVSPEAGRQAQMTGQTAQVAWTDDRRGLWLQPAPPSGAVVRVLATLKPTLASYDFPEVVFQHHAHNIADGALSRLLVMPKTDWQDMTAADVYAGRYRDAVSSYGIQSERGFAHRPRGRRFF